MFDLFVLHVFVCLFVMEIVQLGFLLIVISLVKMAMVTMRMNDKIAMIILNEILIL